MNIHPELVIKFKRFRRDRRAFGSFLALAVIFFVSLPAEFTCNVRPVAMTVDGKWYFPILVTYSEKDFGGTLPSEPDYKSNSFQRFLKGEPETGSSTGPQSKISFPSESFDLDMGDFEDEEQDNGLELGMDDFEEEENITSHPKPEFILTLEDFIEDWTPDSSSTEQSAQEKPASLIKRDVWMLWPPVRYDYKYIPTESVTGQVALAAPYETFSPHLQRSIASSWEDGHYLGTDDRGRDVLARLIYGFRISMLFGISLAITGTIIGCFLGGIQGFFGGWVDLLGQRFTEIWGSIPRLYILIILSAFLTPSAFILFLILNLTAWMGIAAYIRAEFLKSRNLEYVKAAKALGVGNFSIMRKHVLPNSLTPVITFFPFEVTAGILALVSLDFLNLGVPSPAPSMGELLAQGKNNLQAIWILLPTFTVLTFTLTLLTFVGDGIRNAFDPRKPVS